MELPREKLLRIGAKYLKTSELLSIILNTGYKNESVFEISERITKGYEDDLNIFKNVEQIVEQLKIPTVKASQLCACIEIGRRLFDKDDNIFINSYKKIIEIFKNSLISKNNELYLVILNDKNKIISKILVYLGNDLKSISMKSVFRSVFELNSYKFILVFLKNESFLIDNYIDFVLDIKNKSDFIDIVFLDFIIISKEDNISFKNKGII